MDQLRLAPAEWAPPLWEVSPTAAAQTPWAASPLSAISGVGAFPESLNAVLDNIEQRGGIEAYLAQAGVSSEKIAILRSQVISR